MDRGTRDDQGKSDRAASSQFLMIAIAFVFVLIVLAVWHPWVTRPTNGVPQSDVATAHP